MSDDKKHIEALKNLLNMYDHINSSYEDEFGDEALYMLDEEEEELFRKVVESSDDNLEK